MVVEIHLLHPRHQTISGIHCPELSQLLRAFDENSESKGGPTERPAALDEGKTGIMNEEGDGSLKEVGIRLEVGVEHGDVLALPPRTRASFPP